MNREVVVMNKRGAALAADSAVSNGKKVYHIRRKADAARAFVPVAVMTFGAADMMNVLWEVRCAAANDAHVVAR